MRKFNYVSGAAYLALVVVLFGVLAAAESALADGQDDAIDRLPPRVKLADEEARQEAMAEEAANALSSEIVLDLDIQLTDTTSTASVARR